MDEPEGFLVKEIIARCERKDVRVTGDFVRFVLCLLRLKSACRSDKTGDGNVERIITTVISKLCGLSTASLVALKHQLYFIKYYRERDETIKRQRLFLHEKTGPLVAEICNTKRVGNEEDTEKLYQKILVVITLLSGLGNPTLPCILRETSMALQSVFQPSELRHYVSLSKREKEEQLMELMCIVTGIRLFNKDCQRGGEGIDDLPSILHMAVSRSRDTIFELLERLMKQIYRLTAAVENIISVFTIDEDSCCQDAQLPHGITKEDIRLIIETLTAGRQEEIYIRKLLRDIDRCEDEIKNLIQKFQARLFKLHDTVRFRTAIPTAQVYPQFIDLADIWMGLQDEVIVLSGINAFLWELTSLSIKALNVHDERLLDSLIGGREILTDSERLEQSMGALITDCGECTVLHATTTENFEKIHLEFLGFCPWIFVIGKGALIPGNPNNGIVKWRAKYYTFSSRKAAEKFGENPDRWLCKAMNLIRDCLEYVHFFQLYDEIGNLRCREERTENGEELKAVHDQIIQTDTHILPPTIFRDYTSNIWELKRRALHLASISRCATRATQTYKSHFRQGVVVQAAPPRDNEAQTKRDNSTNTRKPRAYIFGLRGRHDDQQRVVSFVEDEYECV